MKPEIEEIEVQVGTGSFKVAASIFEFMACELGKVGFDKLKPVHEEFSHCSATRL